MTIAGVLKSIRQTGMIIASFPFTRWQALPADLPLGKHQENEP